MRYLFLIFLALTVFPRYGFAQTDGEAFKMELHLRGMSLLKKVEKKLTKEQPKGLPSSVAIFPATMLHYQRANAFRSAAALDPDKLVRTTINELKLKPEFVFWQVIENADYFPNLELAFESLKNAKHDSMGKSLYADFAHLIGTWNGDPDRFLSLIEDYLREAPLEGAHPDLEDKETLRSRRTEELWWQFHLGQLENGAKPFVEFCSNVKNPALRENFGLLWFPQAIQEELPVEQVIDCLNELRSKRRVEYRLLRALNELSISRLQSSDGKMLVRHLIENHTLIPKRRRRRGKPIEPDELNYTFEFSRYDNEFPDDSFMPFFSLSIKRDISELYYKSKLAEQEPDLELDPKYSFLQKEEHLRIEEFPSHLSLIIGGGQRIARVPNIESVPIKGSFTDNLKIAPHKRKQPKWIIEFVLRYGWANPQLASGQFPEEGEILDAFKGCKLDDHDLANYLARIMDDNSSPSPASKDILLQMMNLLPPQHRITTRSVIASLEDQIQSDPKAKLGSLLSKSLSLNARNRADQSQFTSQLAFAFAMRGEKEAVEKLLEMIPEIEEQAFTSFQCSLAFPPRAKIDGRMWHSSSRFIGGAF